MNKKEILLLHSLNNPTGSPHILAILIRGLLAKGYPITLITSRGEGFLSDIPGVHYRYTCYRWTNSAPRTLLLLMLSQLQMFCYILFARRRGRIYYINTIVPFGAAMACRLTGKDFVYHVHENMQQHKPIYRLLRWVYKICNRKTIFVSNYLKDTALNCRDSRTIYNAVEDDFRHKAQDFLMNNHTSGRKNVLMVSSLRRFKGIYEFVELAKALPQYLFELVLAASDEEVAAFANETGAARNLKLYSRQRDLHPFYQRARLLLQLSHSEAWVETFGLTILEAMTYGIPAIVPNAGGPLELVDDGVNGYTVDPHDSAILINDITLLMDNDKQYASFAENARKKSERFSEQKMINEIEQYIL